MKPKCLGANVKVELDLSNYTTKTDANDRSSLAKKKKNDFANLKSDVDKLNINKFKKVPTNLNTLENEVCKLNVDKLVPVPVDLSEISDVVKNDVVKKIYITL